MPAYLTETVYRFCTKDLYSMYLQNKSTYRWISQFWIDTGDNELIDINTYRALLTHMDKRGRAPESLDSLLQYVQYNPDGIDEFQKTLIIDENLRDLADYQSEITMDDTLLFDCLFAHAEESWMANSFKVAASIARGATKTPDKLKESGPAAAERWIRTELSKKHSKEEPVLAGMLHENISAVIQSLDDKLKDDNDNGRFPLGLSHIDNAVTVGKNGLKFIGVVGKAGDGKTTLTNFIVYNWLRQGARILYVSTEHTSLEIWEFMTFLHGSHPDYEFTLPSMWEWDQKQVTTEDRTNMYRVGIDIMESRNIAGRLDVQQFFEWDTIVDYLNTNHAQNRYDILVIDYMGRLTVPGDPRLETNARNTMISAAQKLTRTFDNNKGLILLTPIQVNRAGHKLANSEDVGEKRYDLNAILDCNAYERDLDLAISVYSDDDLRSGDMSEIGRVKVRKGKSFGRENYSFDATSGAFMRQGADEPTQQMWERTAEDVVIQADLYITPTTTTINSETWGI